jgi:sarcosine oxidase
MKRLTKRYNAIVIGVGGIGSSTVYALARRGKRVLGLERFDVPHEMGSSHGYTRIIRLPYYEHPSYVMLLRRSYELWREIQQHVGEQLLHITGSIDAGPADSWVFKGSMQSALEYDLPHEVLTGRQINERFPGYRMPPETMGILQPEGGFLVPERCIVSYVEAAMALGAEVHGREAVLDWEPYGEGVRVTTERDVYEADRLVITAGAWNHSLLKMLKGLLTPERQVLAWLQPSKPELFKTTTASPSLAFRALSLGATITLKRRSTPTQSGASRPPKTSRSCAILPSATSPMARARPCRSRPVCLPIRPTAIL